MGTYHAPAAALSCTKCPLWHTRQNVVWGTGEVPAKIMLVGEAPGASEDSRGIPFIGRAGKHLDTLLQAAGLTRDDVYISNRVKCRPPDNRDPLPREREACLDWLEDEIERVKPEVVLLLGRSAATFAFPGAVMKDIRGTLRAMTVRGHTATYFATYHPAAALRQGAVVDRLIIDDLIRAKALLG